MLLPLPSPYQFTSPDRQSPIGREATSPHILTENISIVTANLPSEGRRHCHTSSPRTSA